MTKITLASNLPTASSPWARQVSDGINTLDTTVDRFVNNQTNLNRANNSNIQLLISQNAQLRAQNETLAQQQATLTAQQTELQRQANYQASLITNSASQTGSWNSGDIPGDQTQRWYPSGLKTSLVAATGRILLGYGASQVTVQAGNSSIIAYLRVHVTSSKGTIDTYIGNGLRIFLSTGYFGYPLYGERTVEGLPTDETITLELEYGHWSAGTNPTGNMQFSTPFIRAQVIPA